jgi:8-amino-7-oxononanoate synthase
MDQKLLDKLNKRRDEGTLRSLSHFEGFVDFFSNDYLGFASESVSVVKKQSGGTGSRLISGTTQDILSAERKFAKFFSAEAGLMFNSGYDANLGFFNSVPQRGDTVIYDELIHASVRDGMRLSFASNQAFKHNDLIDLESKLEKTSGTVYVAVESLYSMDGDLASLQGIGELCERHKAYLVVDEAHAAGIFGENGKGLVCALGMEEKVFARLVTFGKAYGSHGGCILGSQELVDYLTNFARSFIYTTALPSYVYERNAEVVESKRINECRSQLQTILDYFRMNFQSDQLISEVNSPIQIVQIGNVERTKLIAARLQKVGIAVKPIYSPTVPEGKERLRLCFHAFNTTSQVDSLVKELSEMFVLEGQ